MTILGSQLFYSNCRRIILFQPKNILFFQTLGRQSTMLHCRAMHVDQRSVKVKLTPPNSIELIITFCYVHAKGKSQSLDSSFIWIKLLRTDPNLFSILPMFPFESVHLMSVATKIKGPPVCGVHVGNPRSIIVRVRVSFKTHSSFPK